MGGESDSSRTFYELGLVRSPPPSDSDAMAEALSRLNLQEREGVGGVGVGVGDVSEREEVGNGDSEKKEVGKREQGLDSEIVKREREESSESEERGEGMDGGGENVENKECGEKRNGEEEDQVRDGDSEKEIGGSVNGDIEEKEEVGEGCDEKKEVGEKEEERDGHNESKGEEREDEGDCKGEKKEEVVSKERVKILIRYPQRPNTQDCFSYLQTRYCSHGQSCWYNHPPKKSSEVSGNSNTECIEGERDGDQEKKLEVVERSMVKHAPPYPQREGKADCMYYLKTGRCSYGANCCFNHPPGNFNLVTEDRKDQNALNDKIGSRAAERNRTVSPNWVNARRCPDCIRYVNEGRCDNGADCQFYHHRSRRPYEFNLNSRSYWQGNHELETELNFLGLPLRPGKNDCPMYMEYGACELSTGCQYNHPNPDPVMAQQNTNKEFHEGDSIPSSEEPADNISSPSCGLPSCMEPMFYPTPKPSFARIKQMLLPPERPDNNGGNKELQAQLASLEGLKDPIKLNSTSSSSSGTGCELLEYPERPGEPLCPTYMKSGSCKLKSECWYDHPRDHNPKDPAKPPVQSYGYNRESLPTDTKKNMVHSSITSEEESIYPERPGEPECPHYMKHGNCKFGPSCKFNHPKRLQKKAPPYSSFMQASRATSGHHTEEMEFPERPGEPECSYYMKHGNCKFGSNCIFHHPRGQNEKKGQYNYVKLAAPSSRFQSTHGHYR
ncbi:Zinc finger CCCH domain-containing protein 37 [Rhynchospora pubera]|uniref:Zinc finger CCCH domain-containing protein 37 n=1 Tax=Rhynchospora pubera TaxID=906938 RepID=A0AAV8AKQ3_9POAL|nr:Zinc finger CCCH domain-containing protein 37 [Rhynchospora pubera]KAJ4810463.1 Zinc finger CCCH domain-containing protein 37 [Rhynchospora pubera]